MSVTAEQKALANGDLLIGRKLGIGGQRWTVARTAGATPATDPTASALTWTGYVYDDTDTRAVQALPAVGVAARTWAAVAPLSSTALLAGDVLTSSADATLRFRITGIDRVAGYSRYLAAAL